MSFGGFSRGFLLSQKERTDKAFEDKIAQERLKEEEEERKRQAALQAVDPTRCFSCRKKIGLTGVRCRCGYHFCGKHRYSDQHNCTFDYREHGKQELEKTLVPVISNKL